MSDGLFTLVNLMGAMANGPSNCGNRKDGKICTAQAGECRYNSRYYSPGMRDQKSWSMPSADESCPERCCYLGDESRDLGSSEERHERMSEMIGAIRRDNAARKAQAALLLGSLGFDPLEVLGQSFKHVYTNIEDE